MGLYKPNGDLVWLSLDSQPLFQLGASLPYAAVTNFVEIAVPKQEEINLTEVLQESPGLIQQVTETTPGIFYIYDLIEQRLIYTNYQMTEILGYSTEEIQAIGLESLFPDAFERLNSLQQGEVISSEYQYRHRNGEWRWLSNHLSLLSTNTDKKSRRVLGIAQDINEQRQSKERLELATTAVNCLIFDWDVESGRVERTNSFTLLLGYTSNEHEPTLEWWRSLVYPEDLQRMDEESAAKQEGDRYITEYRIRHKDGRYIWVEDRGLVVRHNGNIIRVVGSTTDIGDRKQIEADLLDSAERIEMATTAAQLGMWFWDITTSELVWTSQCKALFGLSCDSEISYEIFLNLLHPEDRESTHAAVTQTLEHGIDYNLEYRTIWTDGSVHWIAAKGKAFYSAEGKAVRMMGTTQDITHRKHTEESLARSQESLILAQEAGQIGSFDWNIETGVIVRTEQLEAIFGFEKGCFGGNVASWQERVHEDDLPHLQESLAYTIANQIQEWVVEYRIFRADNCEMRWIEAKARLFYNESGKAVRMIGTNIDVSVRKQESEELRQSQLIYRNLADQMPQLFWITQPDGYHEYYNQRWYDYTGTTFDQVRGSGWTHLLHPDDVERSIEIWNESLTTGKNYDIEYRLLRASDGEYRWHLGRAFPLRDENGQIIKWFGSCTDIHDQKLVEEERTQLLARERIARDEAEKANRIKDEFLAVLSHELRSPLNPILGWAKLLKTRKFDGSTIIKGLDTIERNAKLQIQLIDDLLDVSRILRGKVTLNIGSLDLKTVIDAALETVRLTAENKSIQIKTQFDPNVGKIEADAYRLQQVFGNLLNNAVKFTPQGGQVEVLLGSESRDGLVSHSALITVRDTGLGISPKFLPHVFEYFRQADSSTTRNYGGLGLGLAIVRHLVELHGGSVGVDSPGEGQGASFTVRLPLSLSNQDEYIETDVDIEQFTSSSLGGQKILIVDDIADAREFLCILLEQYGATVTVAASGSEVLNILSQSQPDLLISDLGMPEMDGYGLIGKIRELPVEQGGEIKAIALTAYAGETDRERVLAAGFQKHVAKPVEPEKLLQAIADLLPL
ncbi:MAG: PAS domain-containing protein [Cyanomargarita calcarea GSE-NOS-MK-12-04C]|uniref:Circadian input-output histidine kinase CikA n=1 Tax=Cyanomargarita calcarea GSE-NOS-MK-12-04C TaxID=2839659 RepID=A0A951US03_9CYAN|nr:PAS domain-containing protein [Cyanomargarita calcarea GSE-NOS-MK-12-04C]